MGIDYLPAKEEKLVLKYHCSIHHGNKRHAIHTGDGGCRLDALASGLVAGLTSWVDSESPASDQLATSIAILKFASRMRLTGQRG